MKKVLFSDLDGTIVEGENPLSTKDIEAVKRLQEAGHVFSFCTGRNVQESMPVYNIFKPDYMVLNNGAMIVDSSLHTIFRKTINNKHAKEIFTYCFDKHPELNYTFYAGKDTYAYISEEKQTKILTENGYVSIEGDFKEIFYQEEDDFDILCAWANDGTVDAIKDIQEYVKNNYDGIQGTMNVIYLDITVDHCSKGTGLQSLCNLLEGEVESYCVGDSYNDLSMFEVANHPYTFNRVLDEIKEKTEKQVDYIYEIVDDMLGGN